MPTHERDIDNQLEHEENEQEINFENSPVFEVDIEDMLGEHKPEEYPEYVKQEEVLPEVDVDLKKDIRYKMKGMTEDQKAYSNAMANIYVQDMENRGAKANKEMKAPGKGK